MMVYLLHVISDPMMVLAGPECIPVKTSADSKWVTSVMATMSSIALQIEVIPDQVNSCQWHSDDCVSHRGHRFTLDDRIEVSILGPRGDCFLRRPRNASRIFWS